MECLLHRPRNHFLHQCQIKTRAAERKVSHQHPYATTLQPRSRRAESVWVSVGEPSTMCLRNGCGGPSNMRRCMCTRMLTRATRGSSSRGTWTLIITSGGAARAWRAHPRNMYGRSGISFKRDTCCVLTMGDTLILSRRHILQFCAILLH